MDNASFLDRSVVSVNRRSADTDRIYTFVLGAVGLVPRKIKEQLADFGVRILLIPRLNDETLSDSSDTSSTKITHNNCYSRADKTIFISEESNDPYGSYHTPDVLVGCAQAYDHLTGVTNSDEWLKQLQDDLDHIPQQLQERYKFDRYKEPSKVQQTFSGLFSGLLVFSSEPVKSHTRVVLDELREVFPRTSSILEKLFEDSR